ncbi:hypothetical protein GALMADRAFT_1129654 [Galerina marginata CBS 339.88]|uniref:Uncharacterized protein n=1 Tax=Galerina marginata (strain CBS 339.88) TaxID=685588 RepID=A0A067SK43_GALM3|nr:hypothetical protein GALMADRAFT_1129654 [Galerina marginata CBS 339.88]
MLRVHLRNAQRCGYRRQLQSYRWPRLHLHGRHRRQYGRSCFVGVPVLVVMFECGCGCGCGCGREIGMRCDALAAPVWVQLRAEEVGTVIVVAGPKSRDLEPVSPDSLADPAPAFIVGNNIAPPTLTLMTSSLASSSPPSSSTTSQSPAGPARSTTIAASST